MQPLRSVIPRFTVLSLLKLFVGIGVTLFCVTTYLAYRNLRQAEYAYMEAVALYDNGRAGAAIVCQRSVAVRDAELRCIGLSSDAARFRHHERLMAAMGKAWSHDNIAMLGTDAIAEVDVVQKYLAEAE